MTIHPSILLQTALLSILLVLMNPASAIEEVYKWVDTDGATHYGETPPAIHPASIQKVTLAEHNPETITPPNIQATLDVAKQLEISRLERERFRLEKKKANTEKLRALQAQQTAYNGNRRYYGGGYSSYYPPYYGRPHRPYHPIKPHKPGLSHHQAESSHRPGPSTPGRSSGMHSASAAHSSSPH